MTTEIDFTVPDSKRIDYQGLYRSETIYRVLPDGNTEKYQDLYGSAGTITITEPGDYRIVLGDPVCDKIPQAEVIDLPSDGGGGDCDLTPVLQAIAEILQAIIDKELTCESEINLCQATIDQIKPLPVEQVIDYEHVKIPMIYCSEQEVSIPSTHVRSPFTLSTGEDVRFLRHILLEEAAPVLDTGEFGQNEIILWSGGSFSDEVATRQLMLDKIRPSYEGTPFYLNDILVDFSQGDIRLTFIISGLDVAKTYLINLQIQEGTQTSSPVTSFPVQIQTTKVCLNGSKVLTSQNGDIANASQVLLDNEGNVLNPAGFDIYYDESSQTNVVSLGKEIRNLANVNSLVVRPVVGNATVIINGGQAIIINQGAEYIFENVVSASIDSQTQTIINYNQITWS